MRAVLMSVVMVYSLILFAFVANGCDIVREPPVSSTDRDTVPSDAGTDTQFADTRVGVDPNDACCVSRDASPVSHPLLSRAIAVDARTCDDQTVSLPEGFARLGDTVWHLCYRTPSREDSSSPLTQQESRSVTFTLRSSWTGEPTEMMQVPADNSNVHWTASVIISVPDVPAAYPLFNARNAYGGASLWAVGADETGHALETHGTLTAWRVRSNGQRVLASLRPIVNGCLDPLMPEILNGGSLFPDNETCPEDYYLCGPGRFHCEYEP
jgi:hypothetical protein